MRRQANAMVERGIGNRKRHGETNDVGIMMTSFTEDERRTRKISLGSGQLILVGRHEVSLNMTCFTWFVHAQKLTNFVPSQASSFSSRPWNQAH